MHQLTCRNSAIIKQKKTMIQLLREEIEQLRLIQEENNEKLTQLYQQQSTTI